MPGRVGRSHARGAAGGPIRLPACWTRDDVSSLMTFDVPRLLTLSLLVLMAGPSAAAPVVAPPVQVALIAEATAAPAPGRDAARFVATRARVPVASPATWRLSTRGNADTATLVVDGYDGSLDPPPLFFPRAREVIEHAAPQRIVRTSGGFQLDLVRW